MIIIYNKRVSRGISKTIYLLGENTENDITFTVPIEKEVKRFDKSGEEVTESISIIYW